MVIFTFRIGILFLIKPSGNAFTTLPEVYFPPYSKSSLENIDNKSSNQLHFGHRFHVYTLSVGKLILCSLSDISPSDYISASRLCSSLSQASIMDISFTKELLLEKINHWTCTLHRIYVVLCNIKLQNSK